MKSLKRDERYLNFIRSHPCCICGAKPVDVNHVGTGGIGIKTSDYYTVPLCRMHHGEYHQIGQKRFEAKYFINLYKIMVDLLIEYMSQIELVYSTNI